MNAVTLRQAEQNLESLITQVVSNAEPTIVSTDSGASVVLLDLDEYNAWQETTYLLANPANAAHLRRSMQEADAGQIAEHELIES